MVRCGPLHLGVFGVEMQYVALLDYVLCVIQAWHVAVCRHTEDMDLASVNYLHCGAPKAWYCIPPAHRERFERFLQGMLPDMFRACPEFFRHKVL